MVYQLSKVKNFVPTPNIILESCIGLVLGFGVLYFVVYYLSLLTEDFFKHASTSFFLPFGLGLICMLTTFFRYKKEYPVFSYSILVSSTVAFVVHGIGMFL